MQNEVLKYIFVKMQDKGGTSASGQALWAAQLVESEYVLEQMDARQELHDYFAETAKFNSEFDRDRLWSVRNQLRIILWGVSALQQVSLNNLRRLLRRIGPSEPENIARIQKHASDYMKYSGTQL